MKKSERRHQTDDALRVLASRIQTARAENWFTMITIEDEFEREIEVRVNEIVLERGISAGGRSTLSLEDLVTNRDEIRDMFEAGRYDDVIHRVEALIPRIDPVEQSEEFLTVLDEVTGYREHSSAILEFQARSIEIQGVVFRPEGSAVIINGMVLAAGDPVVDEVVIGMIAEDEIEFHFRSIRISKLIHQ